MFQQEENKYCGKEGVLKRDAGEQRVPGSSLLEYKSVCRLAFCTRFTKPSKPSVGQDGSESAKDGGPQLQLLPKGTF